MSDACRETPNELGRGRAQHRRMGLAFLSCLLTASSALAQVPNFGRPFPPTPEERARQLRQKREAHNSALESAWLQAKAAIADSPDRGLAILQSILDFPEDSPVHDEPRLSIKDSAELLLLDGGESRLESYERQFGQTAQGLLDDAERTGREDQLQNVARRFAMTTAGAKALWRLAVTGFDQGQPRTVRNYCDRIARHPGRAQFEPRLSVLHAWSAQETGEPEQAQMILEGLREQYPAGLPLDSGLIPWSKASADDASLLAMLIPPGRIQGPQPGLRTWSLAHGDRQHNARSPEAPGIFDSGWSYPLVDQYDDWKPENVQMVAAITSTLDQQLARTAAALPVGAPLIVDDKAIVAGYGCVKAVSLKTGEFLWSSWPPDDTLVTLLADTDSLVIERKPSLTRIFVAQRGCRDFVNGALSSDGKLVYHIADGGLVGLLPPAVANVAARTIGPLFPRWFNRLQAYDLAGGKLIWDQGGPPRHFNAASLQQPDAGDLSGTYFCSAPVPNGSELLCIAEQDKQLRLLSLDPMTGDLLWSQSLYNSDRDLSIATDRRFTGVSPAIDGALLVAATGEGAVVAFDIAQRRWLWTQAYGAPPRTLDFRAAWNAGRGMPFRNSDQTTADTLLRTEAWLDARTIISGAQIFVTPIDDQRLLCLDAATGKILWESPRDQSLFLAGADDQSVVLVGRSEIRALRPTNGETLWTTAIPPASGRGAWIGRRYVLPLSTAELITINLDDGQILARSSLPSSKPAGNLVSAPGLLLTESVDALRAFRSQTSIDEEIHSRLAQDPDDPTALAIRGELRLHRGEIEEGEADLKLAAANDRRVARTLAWSLVYGLKRDFDRYYARLDEIQTLSADPALRLTAWRLVSEGLERKGDLAGSFLAAVRAAQEFGADHDPLVNGEGGLRVREQALLKGRVLDLWEHMEPAGQTTAMARVLEHLNSLPRQSGEVVQCLAVLPRQAQPVDFVLQRVEEKLVPQADAEQTLLELWQHADRPIAARAGVDLVGLAITDPRFPPPAVVIDDLKSRLGSEPVEEGKTAIKAVQTLLESPEITKKLAEGRPSAEPLKVQPVEPAPAVQEYQTTVPLQGEVSPLLTGWTFAVDAASTTLAACNAQGVHTWKESISNRGGSNPPPRMSSNGRFVVIETAEGFRIIDAFTGQNVRSGNLFSDAIDNRQFQFARGVAMQRFANSQAVGPIQSEFLAYVTTPRLLMASSDEPLSRLHVVEPQSDRELWSRNVSSPAAVLTDDDHVALVRESGHLDLYRAVDGRHLGLVPIPARCLVLPEFHNGIGRLVRTAIRDSLELAMFNPLTKSFDWELKFPAQSSYQVVDNRFLAVGAPDGLFTWIDILTGVTLFTAQLPPEEDFDRLVVMSDRDRVYACLARKIPLNMQRETPSMVGGGELINGRLVALDRRTGEQLWTHEIDSLSLDLRQPGDWPFLLLSNWKSKLVRQEDKAPMFDRHEDVLLLSRKDGSALYEGELPTGRDNPKGWTVDPATGETLLRFGDRGLQLTYPGADNPAEAANVEPAADSGDDAPKQPAEKSAPPPPTVEKAE
jgi:outer membrane protein assembly factor BamB